MQRSKDVPVWCASQPMKRLETQRICPAADDDGIVAVADGVVVVWMVGGRGMK